MNTRRSLLGATAAALALVLTCAALGQDAPAPPSNLAVSDTHWDGGEKIDLQWDLSPDDPDNVAGYNIYVSMTEKEIEKDNKEIRKKAISKAKRAATAEILGPDWDDDERTVIPSLSPEMRERLRAAREAAATAAAAAADAEVAAKAGQERFHLIDTVLAGTSSYTVPKLSRDAEYRFKIEACNINAVKSPAVISAEKIQPVRQWYDGSRFWLSVITFIFCGAVVYWINHARQGRPLKVRKIAGLEAVDEAVGRATEMGRSCLYIPGIQDINEIQTIASMTILSRVAKTAAEYDAKVEVPTARSLVMTTARETVQAAYLSAGRPDAYNQDLIYYVTDEQFGFVAYLSGMMVREKPAACFYMGAFFAESLILAETGNSIGAIQVAGTAMPAQLPFFVAACDYTLIGEEFFAASAYLSGSPEELGSLKGQDVGKVIVAVLLLIGVGMATLGAMLPASSAFSADLIGWVDFLKNVVLT